MWKPPPPWPSPRRIRQMMFVNMCSQVQLDYPCCYRQRELWGLSALRKVGARNDSERKQVRWFGFCSEMYEELHYEPNSPGSYTYRILSVRLSKQRFANWASMLGHKNVLWRAPGRRIILILCPSPFPPNFSLPPGIDPNDSVMLPRCPWLCLRENVYYLPPPPYPHPSLFFPGWQRNNRSTIQDFHLYSDKGYLGNLVQAISHYGESYEAEIKFCSQWLGGEGRWKVFGTAL